jgi:hypothetical protein
VRAIEPAILGESGGRYFCRLQRLKAACIVIIDKNARILQLKSKKSFGTKVCSEFFFPMDQIQPASLGKRGTPRYTRFGLREPAVTFTTAVAVK